MRVLARTMLVAGLIAGWANAQEENPDFSIRAEFRDSGGESVGNATVKVKSRFMQVYYGGVRRADDYRFQLSLDSNQYANQMIDVQVNDFLVGSHSFDAQGYLDITYRSDWKPDDAPDLKLPVGFPDPIDVGDLVSIFDSTSHALLLTSIFGEEFERGDADHDNDVDDDDYDVWAGNYGSSGLGPANGDFNGDGQSNLADYTLWRDAYTESGGLNAGSGAVPEPTSTVLVGIVLAAYAGWRRR